MAMAVDLRTVWLDSVFEDSERSPQLTFRARSKDALGSLERAFEEHTTMDQSATNRNGYGCRNQLVVTSTSGEDHVHYFSTGSTSSGGSPRGNFNSSRSSHGSHSSPLASTTIKTNGVSDGEYELYFCYKLSVL